MESREEFDFESFKKEAVAGLSSGKKMSGSDGILAPLLKHLLESVLEGELDHHLADSRASGQKNRKNGKTSKTVRSLSAGEFDLESTRDRLGTFEPCLAQVFRVFASALGDLCCVYNANYFYL